MPVSSQTYANIATISIVLFSIFVSYDTNRMLNKNNTLDVMDNAMSFYLDIENLFVNFVEIGLNRMN
jgi:FtsH-binding integral membrane protein